MILLVATAIAVLLLVVVEGIQRRMNTEEMRDEAERRRVAALRAGDWP